MLVARYVFTATLVVSVIRTATASDRVYYTVTPGSYSGVYDESQYRNSTKGTSINIQGNVINQWGFSVGFEHSQILYNFGIPAYEQDAIYLSGYLSNAPERTFGTYTTRLDYNCVIDRTSNDYADDACVIAPQISYLRYDNSLYFDLGYAISDYGTGTLVTEPLRIEQWTPTLGFSLNQHATHWMRLRGYLIHSNNLARSQQINQTNALEIKYFYYPLSHFRIIPTYIDVSAMAGERMYAVDRDTSSISNLSDLENNAQSLGAQWHLSKSFSVVISASRTRFYNSTAFVDKRYTLRSTWLGLVTHW